MLGLLRATGVLCVYGSGFGMPAADGFLRIVFLASLDELHGHLRSDGRVHGEYLSSRSAVGGQFRLDVCALIAVR